ncbi:MAG: glycosyltransferase family 2 protein [Eubacteriales bacterium]|nr:glycosyltransferase family 2 protein [Eubacteriales bacterium]
MSNIPIVIPSYEPDGNLIKLLEDLKDAGLGPVILVDDGSGERYGYLFEQARDEYQCHILKHAVNMGKGRALKSAFNYLLNEYQEEEILGCLTADSDGQHGVKDIKKCMEALEKSPQKLILGCRDFDLPSVPSKSKFGNKLTHYVCKWLCGIDVSDTQTGLRAIPGDFMRFLLNTPGERFEFETNMLLDSKGKVDIEEVKIETIYDSKENHATHFNPIMDSIKIYKIFGKCFLKFIVSSLSSSAVDLILFSILCGM